MLLPLVKPGLTTLAILGMLNTWKDLMWPLIVNTDLNYDDPFLRPRYP